MADNTDLVRPKGSKTTLQGRLNALTRRNLEANEQMMQEMSLDQLDNMNGVEQGRCDARDVYSPAHRGPYQPRDIPSSAPTPKHVKLTLEQEEEFGRRSLSGTPEGYPNPPCVPPPSFSPLYRQQYGRHGVANQQGNEFQQQQPPVGQNASTYTSNPYEPRRTSQQGPGYNLDLAQPSGLGSDPRISMSDPRLTPGNNRRNRPNVPAPTSDEPHDTSQQPPQVRHPLTYEPQDTSQQQARPSMRYEPRNTTQQLPETQPSPPQNSSQPPPEALYTPGEYDSPYQLQLQQPQPLLGFSDQENWVEGDATSGPLDETVYADFRPGDHEVLMYEDPLELARQYLFYVDIGPQRREETDLDFRRRHLRATVNMQQEHQRRPPVPQYPAGDRARAERRLRALEEEHRNRLNFASQEYDPTYAAQWQSDQQARRARNRARRVAAVTRLRNEYRGENFENWQDFPDPPEPEDSGDELWSHDMHGPLARRRTLGDASGRPDFAYSMTPPLGSPVNSPRISNDRPRARQRRSLPDENLGDHQPSAAGGQLGQGDEPRNVSQARCAECSDRRVKCSVKETGYPCDRCRRKGLKCKVAVIKKQGVKRGAKRGPYNTAAKRAKRAKKQGEGQGPDEEYDSELERDFDNGDPEGDYAPGSYNKRRRDDDEEEEQRPASKKQQITKHSTKETPASNSGRKDKSIGNSNGQQRPSYQLPCNNCQRYNQTCSLGRPCSQCKENFEYECDGVMIEYAYKSPTQHMTLPPAAPRDLRGQVFPSPGSYAERFNASPPRLMPQTTGAGEQSIGFDNFLRVPERSQEIQTQSPAEQTRRPSTADEVARRASESWPDHRDSARRTAPRRRNGSHVTAPLPHTDPPNTIASSIDPGFLSVAANPDLPLPSDTSPANQQIRRDSQQTARYSSRSSSKYSPLKNLFIGMTRIPEIHPEDLFQTCDEPLGIRGFNPGETCEQVPTKPCDQLQHGFFKLCAPCEVSSRDVVGFDEVEFVSIQVKNYTCTPCSQAIKEQMLQDLDADRESEVQTRDCLCIRQVKMAWLCREHRLGAIERISDRTRKFERAKIREVGEGGKCPCYDERKGDASTRTWVCGACGEKVVAP